MKEQHIRQAYAVSLWFLVVLTLTPVVVGVPYTILSSPSQQCVFLEVSNEMVVTIEYHAPDVVVPNNNGKQDMSLLVFQNKSPKKTSNRRSTGSSRIRTEIETPKGAVHFYTGNSGGGQLEICRQSFQATPAAPRRIALNITQRAATAQEQEQNAPILDEVKPQKKETIPEKEQQGTALLHVESSRISLELGRMEEKLHELASHSERSRDMEQEFHQKQVQLQGAVRYWPMFRISVVLIAGVAQAIWAVNHMKSRHVF